MGKSVLRGNIGVDVNGSCMKRKIGVYGDNIQEASSIGSKYTKQDVKDSEHSTEYGASVERLLSLMPLA